MLWDSIAALSRCQKSLESDVSKFSDTSINSSLVSSLKIFSVVASEIINKQLKIVNKQLRIIFICFRDNLFEAKQTRILETIRKISGEPEMNFPRDEKGRIQVPRKMYEDPRYRIDFIVHQENFSRFDNYSFPDPYIVWEEGNSTLLLEKNLTKEHIIYIHTDGMHIGPIYRSKLFLCFTITWNM